MENKDFILQKIVELEQKTGWYQNIDLGNGIQTKSRQIFGEEIDHPRSRWNEVAPAIPKDLSGKSVLDLGCNAGFFSFEAKKRGADYVCGIDLKEPYIEQANFCSKVLKLDVDFRVLSIMDLNTLGRDFDYVFFVGLLYHCPEVFAALKSAAQVCKHKLILETAIHPYNEDYPLVRFVRNSHYKSHTKGSLPGWWHPNMTALRDMLLELGFKKVETLFKKGGRGGVWAER